MPGAEHTLDEISLLAQVEARIARLETRLQAVVAEKERLAGLVTEQDRRITDLTDTVADLTRLRLEAGEAIDGILKLIGTLERRLAAQRGG